MITSYVNGVLVCVCNKWWIDVMFTTDGRLVKRTGWPNYQESLASWTLEYEPEASPPTDPVTGEPLRRVTRAECAQCPTCHPQGG